MLTLEQNDTKSSSLVADVVEMQTLNDNDRVQMFALYKRYYAGSEHAIFNADLNCKTHVVLLRDNGQIQGFSTLVLYREEYQGKLVQVIYSGDTIVDRAHWGQPLLPKAWLQFAGKAAVESPGMPLYWLLIAKGHRTYKYLQLFSREYYPRYDQVTPKEMRQLMTHLASKRFGDAYHQEAGLVYFPEPRSFLNSDLAVIPDKDLKRSEVQFFLSKNPHYAQGDELVCLCRLCPENLTRVSLNWFLQGMQQITS